MATGCDKIANSKTFAASQMHPGGMCRILSTNTLAAVKLGDLCSLCVR